MKAKYKNSKRNTVKPNRDKRYEILDINQGATPDPMIEFGALPLIPVRIEKVAAQPIEAAAD